MSEEESQQASKLAAYLAAVPEAIDKIVAAVDRVFGEAGVCPLIGKRSIMAFCLPLPVWLFVVCGPSMASPAGGPAWHGGIVSLAVLLAAVGVQLIYFLLGRRLFPRKRLMHWVHFGLTFAIVVFVWRSARADATELSSQLYRHYYAPTAFLLMAIAVPVAFLTSSARIFRIDPEVVKSFGAVLEGQYRQLATPPPPREFNGWDVARSYAISLFDTPLHVMMPVALAVLVGPADHLGLVALITGALSLMLFATANYDPDRRAFVQVVSRSFLTGGAFVVSLVVFVFAGLRLAGVSYVTTVLDATSKLTILSYLASTYVLIWFYDFWANQAALEILGDLPFTRSGDASVGKLLKHGGGRIMVRFGKSFRIYEPAELLSRLAVLAPTEPTLAVEALRTDQRLRTFRGVVAGLAVLVLVFGVRALSHARSVPGLEVTRTVPAEQGEGSFDLTQRLKTSQQPVIAIAASGGGTRAALYTAAVLHGIGRLHSLDRVVLASGVSGGSAALAYFAINRNVLIAGDGREWQTMEGILAEPYIDDVLAGAGEMRVLGGVRLGQLLTESFERHFGGKSSSHPVRLGAVKEIGLIFNTAICGGSGDHNGARGSAEEAGGRLVITNVKSGFVPAQEDYGWPLDLPFEVVRDPRASLFASASLSANFPPVFSNAEVAIHEGKSSRSVWVTDGGAVENRGVISALLALRESLKEIADDDRAKGKASAIPDIRLVVAEASAFDPEYRSDRGLGAKFGASEKLANRLIKELVDSVQTLHQEISGRHTGFKVVYLPMPDALRAAGTFGTHWMMPPLVAFGVPGDAPQIELPSAVVIDLIDGLFDPALEAHVQSQRRKDAKVIMASLGTPWTDLERGLR